MAAGGIAVAAWSPTMVAPLLTIWLLSALQPARKAQVDPKARAAPPQDHHPVPKKKNGRPKPPAFPLRRWASPDPARRIGECHPL